MKTPEITPLKALAGYCQGCNIWDAGYAERPSDHDADLHRAVEEAAAELHKARTLPPWKLASEDIEDF